MILGLQKEVCKMEPEVSCTANQKIKKSWKFDNDWNMPKRHIAKRVSNSQIWSHLTKKQKISMLALDYNPNYKNMLRLDMIRYMIE